MLVKDERKHTGDGKRSECRNQSNKRGRLIDGTADNRSGRRSRRLEFETIGDCRATSRSRRCRRCRCRRSRLLDCHWFFEFHAYILSNPRH